MCLLSTKWDIVQGRGAPQKGSKVTSVSFYDIFSNKNIQLNSYRKKDVQYNSK